MGCIEKVKLQDVGYNYPSDPTLKVFANVPEILILEELCSFGEIGITSGASTPEVLIDEFINYLKPSKINTVGDNEKDINFVLPNEVSNEN